MKHKLLLAGLIASFGLGMMCTLFSSQFPLKIYLVETSGFEPPTS